MSHRPALRALSTRVTRRALAALAVALTAAAALAASAPAAAPPQAAAHLLLDGFVFEAGQPVPGQLVVRNDGGGWLKTEDLGDLAGSLRLKLPGGEDVKPEHVDAFGAARAKEIGPGGFVGVKFDLRTLFPQLAREGNYTLQLKRSGLPSPTVSFRILPAFNPATQYRLLFTTPDGELAVDLAKDAPQSARALVTLARTGFYDKAAINTIRPGFGFSIASAQNASPPIEPAERTTRELLAGTVVLEPGPLDANGLPTANRPTLLVLVAPRPEWLGRVTVVGQVAGSDAALSKLVQHPTNGERGVPPWKPVAPLTIESVRVVENP
jgi:cyclophilin family peptidyl-prolyl cis-trans isomerase